MTWPDDLDFYIELDQFYANDYNFYTEMEYLLNSSSETWSRLIYLELKYTKGKL